jgi:starch-binding outer membrane protein, SusD/RagB family
MRKLIIKLSGIAFIGLAIFSCKKSFLERPPEASLNEETLANKFGANAALIAAYAALDGWTEQGWNNAAGNPWPAAGSNWIWGSVSTDDAYPGSQPNDQLQVEQINRYDWQPDFPYFRAKFQTVYWGVGRVNIALRLMDKATDMTTAEKDQLIGEARFLRAHYHFDAYKMWQNVPYYDEKISDYRQPNTADIFPKIVEDFQAAITKLGSKSNNSSARANKEAAQAYLARAYMYKGQYSNALPLLNAVISSGKYSLESNFHDNFDPAKQNNNEMIFAFKSTVNDGAAESHNGNWGDRLNFPHGSTVTTCCGFHQPSQNLLNAFKTDANGLPFATNNNTNYNQATDNLDPRADWTIGRTGMPYLDWGVHADAWVRDGGYSGFLSPKKNQFHKAQEGTLSTASGWSNAPNAIDIPFIRYSDVLLMAAECEIETGGNLTRAAQLVNQVRTRAGNFAQGAGTSEATISQALTGGAGVINGTTYKIGTYPVPFASQAAGRDAVRFERRLELAMEGYRLFDLRRWGNMVQVLNDFVAVEKNRRTQLFSGVQAVTAKYMLYPLPSVEIELSKKDGVAQLKQNTGW